MSGVSERLTVCRERLDISYRDLAVRVGVSFSHLSHVHTGEKEATLGILDKLAPIYRSSVPWLRDGNPEVNVWSEFQETRAFKEVNDPSVGPARRVKAVLVFINDYYSGHLCFADVAKLLDLSYSVIRNILDGKAPTDHFIRELQRLTGVPASWMQLGSFAPLSGLGPIDGITPDELKKLLALGVKAKAIGIRIDNLAELLEVMGNAKGRA